MSSIQLTLPDGSVREAEAGISGLDFAASIGRSLGKAAVGLIVDGELRDVRSPLTTDATVRILTAKDEDGLEVLRHSMAHCMAQALARRFPGASLAIGPTVEDGFYYDVLVDQPIGEDDLRALEKEMAKVIKENVAIERFEMSRADALAWAEEQGQQFKTEIIEGLPEDEVISFYRQGEFTDLCSGPHLARTGKLGRGFKLMKVAGAYWRGDESREQLQRLYGTAWFSPEDLEDYLHRLEEAKKRDHRKLGRELDLFSFHEEAPAMPFFHPKGAFVYNQLIEYVRELYREWGFDEVITPQVLDVDIWHRSGHYANYRDGMYFATFDEHSEGEPSWPENPSEAVKPMNCPTHCLIFGTRKRSYRDLPIRYADFGRLHRYERSGVTAGLFRVRSFAQDDSHIFCTEGQIGAEVRGVTEMLLGCYRTFGFEDVRIYLSTRPEKAIGSEELWARAEAVLSESLREMGVDFEIQEGEGAFYGPKIDFAVRDALKREWQLGTCQLDFNAPERFDLKYTTAENEDARPVMIHRAMLGSLERFLGVLIEQTAGDLPLWLAPEQCRVMSITDDQVERVGEVVQKLETAGIRARPDLRNEKMGLKVREASLAKVRYQLIIGPRELERGTVAVRHRTDGDVGEMDLDDLQALLLEQVRVRA